MHACLQVLKLQVFDYTDFMFCSLVRLDLLFTDTRVYVIIR
jgi:hypothetical protein